MSKCVAMVLVEAIWMLQWRKAKAVPGMRRRVLMLLKEAIWRCCNGREAKAVRGIRTHVAVLLVEAIWRC